MPELPEVETVVRALARVMLGKVLSGVTLTRGDLRKPFPAQLEKRVAGQRILSVSRRAKYILIHLTNDGVIVIHLGMSGRIRTENRAAARQKHDHMILRLSDGLNVVLNDARRFGQVAFVAEQELSTHECFRNLGMEPLTRGASGAALQRMLRDRKTPVKQALLDQRMIAGIGNIYACEALFRAGIDPSRPAGDLTAAECRELMKAIQRVLKRAIQAGGSTLRDYRQVSGESGYFQHDFEVYGRADQSCRTCGGCIKRITQGGRTTFYCPSHQR
jgi:formamidopyrimidine-DNA glycosylase